MPQTSNVRYISLRMVDPQPVTKHYYSWVPLSVTETKIAARNCPLQWKFEKSKTSIDLSESWHCRIDFSGLSSMQLFRERLSYKRGKAYATMSQVIMGNGGV